MVYLHIFANIYDKNQPNVGKHTIHGSYGLDTIGGLHRGPLSHGVTSNIDDFSTEKIWNLPPNLCHAREPNANPYWKPQEMI